MLWKQHIKVFWQLQIYTEYFQIYRLKHWFIYYVLKEIYHHHLVRLSILTFTVAKKACCVVSQNYNNLTIILTYVSIYPRIQ